SVKFNEAGKKVKSDFTEGVPVWATVTAYDKDGGAVAEEKLIGKYEGNELFLRTTFSDYDIIRIGAVCGMGEALLSLESPVEKR
ncbi:MAG: hypothetical protein IJP90_11885, partial [Treponema sp.]|nr:hypothetical protein [Treponema sp.]